MDYTILNDQVLNTCMLALATKNLGFTFESVKELYAKNQKNLDVQLFEHFQKNEIRDKLISLVETTETVSKAVVPVVTETPKVVEPEPASVDLSAFF